MLDVFITSRVRRKIIVVYAKYPDFKTHVRGLAKLIKEDAGNITLFAFDEGQELSEHTAPYDALVHVLDGEVEVKISGKPFPLGPGDAIIMPAHEPHALKAVTKFKMLLTMIRK